MVQFTEGLPGLVEDGERFYFDTARPDLLDQLTEFYTRYLAATEEATGMPWRALVFSGRTRRALARFSPVLPNSCAQPWMLKGQVTGPFTLGTNLLDQDRRCAYYDEQLRDVVVKAVALKARRGRWNA